ncbi:MAG TPA: hypothetical protein V6D19_14405 [Stenomitos sp.]
MIDIKPEQTLLALKIQYEQALATVEAKAAHYKEQLGHVNALLLNQLVSVNGTQSAIISADLDLPATNILDAASTDVLALAPSATEPEPSEPVEATAPSKPRSSKTKAAEAKTTATEAIKPKSKRNSLPLLPIYNGLGKLEAISKILEENRGEVLHHDIIIRRLYGELSPEDLKAERVRIKTAMLTGVKQKRWQKAPKPSSYIIKAPRGKAQNSAPAPAVAAAPAAPAAEANPTDTASSSSPTQGRKARKQKAKSPSQASSPASTSIGEASTAAKVPQIAQDSRIVLPLLPEYEGLSKIDAVLKVMNDNAGNVVNIDEIIERLFGPLSLEDYKAEKTRTKDVMYRGIDRGLWLKADAPLSFTVPGNAKSAPKAKSARKGAANKTAKPSTKKTTSRRGRSA